MDVAGFLNALRSSPYYRGQIVHVHTEPARQAAYADMPEGLLPDTRRFLEAGGTTRLYRHQCNAIEAACSGADVLVTTGPASGKSLCYRVPLLQTMLADAQATALLLFPAKALARDQAESWNRALAGVSDRVVSAACRALPFDGDCSAADRRLARDLGRILVTNPEMVHARLLPYHGRWARFFQGLRWIVLDEVHVYTGFFGANMANVVRRLMRVCAHYGASPRFMCSSATVGNPLELAEHLTGRRFVHIDEDTAGRGSRTFVFWNPPKIKRRMWRGRRSANVEAHELMTALLRRRVPTICFSKARNTAEMMYRYVREALAREAPGLVDRVIPYRGGYSPAQRRDMERRLREGEVLGVSATRALELGIDIGMLEASIIIGYPGTLNAFFQQAGRAGRGRGDSLCMLVGTGTLINQFVMNHPEFIFERPIEQAVIDSDNPFVVLGHLRCAASELPLASGEHDRFGYAAALALEVLEEKGKLHRIEDTWYHAAHEAPALDVRLRGYGDESTVIMDAATGEVIDRMDKFKSMRLFYPGAIYFHRGDTYTMLEHDTDRNVVLVQRKEVAYYTDPITGTTVDHIDRVLDTRPLPAGTACLGEVYAVLSTPCYERVRFYSLERLSMHPTNLPTIAYEAMAFWIEADPELPRAVRAIGLDPYDGMRGILYCVSRILPLFLTSDANDFDWSLGCRNSPEHTMFWFEFYLQGIGHSEQCFERLEEILSLSLEHMLTCDCEDGCPNCTSRLITPYHVRNIELGEGTVHSRRAAAVVLNCLLSGVPPSDSLALVEAPREKRGMVHLPAVTLEQRRPEPHRMPLSLRTKRLMLRRVERARHPKEATDHTIDLVPPEGIPEAEPQTTVKASDDEARAEHGAIRRAGDPIARRLRKRLATKAHKPQGKAADGTTAEHPQAPPTDRHGGRLRDRLGALDRSRQRPRPGPAEPVSPGQDDEDAGGHGSSGPSPRVLGDDLARRARKRRRRKPPPPSAG